MIIKCVIICLKQSTLRENSLELENAKSLLSEKEVIIKNLEEELARCRSELDSREKKLNDVEVRIIKTHNTDLLMYSG
jgi:septal ring factor EnvC (AmiA/AmiB activator)